MAFGRAPKIAVSMWAGSICCQGRLLSFLRDRIQIYLSGNGDILNFSATHWDRPRRTPGLSEKFRMSPFPRNYFHNVVAKTISRASLKLNRSKPIAARGESQ